MLPRLLLVLLAVPLLLLAGCAHENDPEPAEKPESAEKPEPADGFARRAFAAMDAADTCPDLEAAWDEYVDPTTRAAIERLVPCTRKVLAAEHPVGLVHEVDADWYGDSPLPTAFAEADEVAEVRLDVRSPFDEESFPFDEFLGFEWAVITDDADRQLFNLSLVTVDECLRTQETCRMAG